MQISSSTVTVLVRSSSMETTLIQQNIESAFAMLTTCLIHTSAENKDARDAIYTADYKYLIVGSDAPNTGGYITKADTVCTVVWNRVVTKSNYYYFTQVIQLADGSFIVAGHHMPSSYYVPWLVSVSNAGDLNWENSYTGYTSSINIYGLDAVDDYSVTMVGYYVVSYPRQNPIIIKATLSCPSGGTDCVSASSCSAGYYSSSGSCAACPAGTYSAALATSCTQCLEGYYQDKSAQTSCITCPTSKISTAKGSPSCTDCPDGYYVCQEGSTSCTACPKKYCGPCQLNDRSACLQLNGLCWSNYENRCAPVTLTGDCFLAIAKICYKIWLVNGVSDPQCEGFVYNLNFYSMQLKPSLLTASYTTDGQSILLEFDQDMSQRAFTDASAVFDSETLKWFPYSKSAIWITSRVLKVAYSPEIGIMTKLNIRPNALYSSYQYAQVAVVATDFPVSTSNEFIGQNAGSRIINKYCWFYNSF